MFLGTHAENPADLKAKNRRRWRVSMERLPSDRSDIDIAPIENQYRQMPLCRSRDRAAIRSGPAQKWLADSRVIAPSPRKWDKPKARRVLDIAG
jgi:hypothetical protein